MKKWVELMRSSPVLHIFNKKKKKKKTHDRNFHRAHETRKEVGLPTFIEKRNREGGL